MGPHPQQELRQGCPISTKQRASGSYPAPRPRRPRPRRAGHHHEGSGVSGWDSPGLSVHVWGTRQNHSKAGRGDDPSPGWRRTVPKLLEASHPRRCGRDRARCPAFLVRRPGPGRAGVWPPCTSVQDFPGPCPWTGRRPELLTGFGDGFAKKSDFLKEVITQLTPSSGASLGPPPSARSSPCTPPLAPCSHLLARARLVRPWGPCRGHCCPKAGLSSPHSGSWTSVTPRGLPEHRVPPTTRLSAFCTHSRPPCTLGAPPRSPWGPQRGWEACVASVRDHQLNE